MVPLLLRAACAAALLPAMVCAAPLTLDRAIDLAVQRSDATRAARAGAASATEAARAADRFPDPMLSVGVENVPVTGADRFSTTADSMTMKRVGISQEWVSADKRAARRGAAQAAVDRESLMVDTAQAETRLQTTLAYLDAYYAGETLALATQSEHHMHESLEVAKARLSSSTGSAQEVLEMTGAWGAAEDDTAEARQRQAAAAVALERWTGPWDDALAPPVLPAAPTEARYVASHPRVLAAQRELDLARGQAAVAVSDRAPNWTWQVSYGQRQGYSDMVSFGVSIPLPIARAERQDRDVASMRARVDQAQATLDDTVRAVTAEARRLASDRERLEARVERYRTGVIVPAQQRTQAALAAFRSNQTSLVALLDARHAEVDAQRKLLSLQRELAIVHAHLIFDTLTTAGDR